MKCKIKLATISCYYSWCIENCLISTATTQRYNSFICQM